MSEQAKSPTPERVMQFAWGYAPPLILEAAIRHGIFDTLDQGPKDASQVAEATGISLRGARAVLNALVGLELLARIDDRYALTEESTTFLVSTRPSFYGGIFRHVSEQLLPKWLPLTEVVRTGKPAEVVNEENTGGEFFAQFVEALIPLGYAGAQALAKALGAHEAQPGYSVLDLAAGSGVWSIPFAQASPNVRATAVDWPEVLPVTRRVTARFGVESQYAFTAGDLLEADFGTGHTVATLGHILHSEGEARSRKLLAKVFDALAPGGTIAIAEFVPNDERTGPPLPLIFAVNMLVATSEGDTFTFAEIRSWLEEVSFTNARQLEAPAPSPLILATKP